MIRIEIDEYDTPIEVANKLISEKVVEHQEYSDLAKNFVKGITGKEPEGDYVRNMFTVDEIKEIADYLMVYYEAHKGDDND